MLPRVTDMFIQCRNVRSFAAACPGLSSLLWKCHHFCQVEFRNLVPYCFCASQALQACDFRGSGLPKKAFASVLLSCVADILYRCLKRKFMDFDRDYSPPFSTIFNMFPVAFFGCHSVTTDPCKFSRFHLRLTWYAAVSVGELPFCAVCSWLWGNLLNRQCKTTCSRIREHNFGMFDCSG